MLQKTTLREAVIVLGLLAWPSLCSGQWIPISPQSTLAETTDEFNQVELAADDQGELLALWLEDVPGANQGTHTGRRFDLENQPTGDSFVTGETDYFTGPQALAATGAGDFVVSWTYGYSDPCPPGAGPDCDFFAAYGRQFDRSGQPIGDPIRFTDGEAGSDDRSNEGSSPKIAVDPAGGFLVAWIDDLFEEIRSRPYDASGNAGDSYTVLSAETDLTMFGLRAPQPVHRPGGGYSVLWSQLPEGTDSGELWLRHLDSGGRPTGEAVQVAATHRSATDSGHILYHPDGRGLIAWLDAELDAPFGNAPDRIQTRAILPDGSLSPTTRGAALDEDGLRGLKLVLLQGAEGFVVGWRAEDTATVEVRQITLDGEPVGDISTLAVVGPGDSSFARLAWDLESGPNGELVMAWENDTDTALLAQRFGPPCGPEILCLGTDDRFRVQVNWRVDGGNEGRGQVRDQQTLDTGSFWFFNPDNVELVVKVLDGRPINGHFWVFYGSLSNVAFDLEITDTVTGRRALYQNPAGTQASRGDTEALPAP